MLYNYKFPFKEKTDFFKLFPSKFVNDLKKKIKSHSFLQKEKRFNNLELLTSLIDPCYYGKTIFDIIKNSNLQEGDLIRFFRQILDKIGQIKNATNDNRLMDLLNNCQKIINDSMKDIDVI